jgi:macrolide transport system ATP-binding/permease protein
VARLDNIPRKLPFAVFGAGQFRMRGRGHGAMVRIRNAKERVARLTEDPVSPPPEPLTFTAEITTDAAQPEEHVAELTDVRVGDRLGIDSLRLGPGGRLLITGPNGSGKTTLLRVLSGELTPDSGLVRVTGRVGHLRQEQTPWQKDMTVLQAFTSGRAGDIDEHIEALLSLGLFSPDDLRQRVEDLSYGQRRRIELARLVTEPVDLLLLDEPTNHLSPALVEELEEALTGYQGTVVVVTHDRRMRSRFKGAHLTLRDGNVADFTAA